MPGRNTFVAEIAIDLVHAIKSAYHQSLQVKFRRDPQIQIHVERVVVGDERLRDGAARHWLHHRSFNFEESVLIQKLPHGLHQSAALEENFADFRIHRQIEVALAIAQFNIGQSVPFFWQRQQVFG